MHVFWIIRKSLENPESIAEKSSKMEKSNINTEKETKQYRQIVSFETQDTNYREKQTKE